MVNSKVSCNIHGNLNYDAGVVRKVEAKIEEFVDLPVSHVIVYMSDITDKRWNGKKEPEKCKECDVSQAGYKTQEMCDGCSASR